MVWVCVSVVNDHYCISLLYCCCCCCRCWLVCLFVYFMSIIVIIYLSRDIFVDCLIDCSLYTLVSIIFWLMPRACDADRLQTVCSFTAMQNYFCHGFICPSKLIRLSVFAFELPSFLRLSSRLRFVVYHLCTAHTRTHALSLIPALSLSYTHILTATFGYSFSYFLYLLGY